VLVDPFGQQGQAQARAHVRRRLAGRVRGAGTISGQLLTNLQVFADTLKNRYTLTGTSRNTSYEMVVWSPAAPDFVNKKGVHTRLTDLITGVQLAHR
jgi:hypothetical protein